MQPTSSFSPRQRQLAAVALAILAWLLLAPWRPILAGDDWGFYNSVLLTIRNGWPTVSDWLNPATIGLTVPATWAVQLTGQLWLGSLLVIGGFGVAALLGWARLLAVLGVAERRPRAILVLAFFPIFLGKWVRFESALPGLALLLWALVLLLAATSASPGERRGRWQVLGASLLLSWALLIRQNHGLALLIGGLLLIVGVPWRRWPARLLGWAVAPALALLFLTVGQTPSFAQRFVTHYNLVLNLSSMLYLDNLARAVATVAGLTLLLALLVQPRATLAHLARRGRRTWLAGLALTLWLLARALLSDHGLPGSHPPPILCRSSIFRICWRRWAGWARWSGPRCCPRCQVAGGARGARCWRCRRHSART